MFVCNSRHTPILGFLAWLVVVVWAPVFGETVDELEARARVGEPQAQYQLAIALEKGDEQKKSILRILQLLNKAAQKGHKEAELKLNNLIREIEEKSSKQDADSEFLLGFAKFFGLGKSKDEKEGLRLLQKTSQDGNNEAQYYLGHILLGTDHLAGLGSRIEETPKNLEKGIEWLEKSAYSGNLDAMSSLFGMYVEGKFLQENYEEAFKIAKKGSNLNDSAAAASLGAMYLYGVGVEHDVKKALSYFHKSAELGNQSAKVFLGATYNPENWEGQRPAPGGWHSFFPQWMVTNLDIGVRNPQEAVRWLKEAAKMFNHTGYEDDCENAIGNAYFNGQGVDKDYKKAINWWQKAIVKRPNRIIGNSNALYHLGMAYKNGHGVSRDMTRAIQYFEMSAKWHPYNSARELLQIYDQENGLAKTFLSKAKATEIPDHIIWEFLEKKSPGFSNSKGEGYTLEEVFDYLAKNNLSIDDFNRSGTKQALLIANSNYSQFGGLANTGSDAQKLSKTLQALGFQVSILQNASREEMLDALRQFEENVRGTDALAFFHYGGHGVQVDGKNYLIPADAEIPDERRVATRAVDLDEVIASIEMAKPKASVLVVDACRHNPLPASATRTATRGLAVVGRKPKNSVIIFAAEAGNEALDGLFTPILAKNLQEHSDKSLNQIMQKVRTEVFDKSNGAQTPGEYNQLFEELYFRQPTN